jgi:Uncharacterized protein conserved in bacteria (DUF2188)
MQPPYRRRRNPGGPSGNRLIFRRPLAAKRHLPRQRSLVERAPFSAADVLEPGERRRVSSLDEIATLVDLIAAESHESGQAPAHHLPRNRRIVAPNPRGGWDVTHPGAPSEDSTHPTQAEALVVARRRLCSAGGGELVTLGADGSADDTHTVVGRYKVSSD